MKRTITMIEAICGQATQQTNSGEGMENVANFEYSWRQVRVNTDDEEVPGAFRLDPAYPNPFNRSTTITYHLAVAGPVSVRVYDALGRLVSILAEGSRQPASTTCPSRRRIFRAACMSSAWRARAFSNLGP